MSCNNNSFLDNLKSKMDSIDTPDFSAFETAISEAETAINSAIDDAAGFLKDIAKEADLSFQEMMNDLQNSSTLQELEAKIALVKKEFGDAVTDLDDMIDDFTGGISKVINGALGDFDSDLQSAQNAVADFLSGSFNFPSPCDGAKTEKDGATTYAAPLPNYKKKPDGTVVIESSEPVTPAAKPADPPVSKKTQNNVAGTQSPLEINKQNGIVAYQAMMEGRKAIDRFLQKKKFGVSTPSPGVLTESMIEALQIALFERESGRNYTVINDKGYVGGYQFGAIALAETGYLNRFGSYPNSLLNNPANWTGKDNVHSLQDFLQYTDVQDSAFKQLVRKNFGYMKNFGTITSETTSGEIGGYLAAAHLLGPINDDAKLTTSDAYGTKGTEYFALGKKACDNVPGETDFDTNINADTQQLIYAAALKEVWQLYDPNNYHDVVLGYGVPNNVTMGNTYDPFKTTYYQTDYKTIAGKYNLDENKVKQLITDYSDAFRGAAYSYHKRNKIKTDEWGAEVWSDFVYYWRYSAGGYFS